MDVVISVHALYPLHILSSENEKNKHALLLVHFFAQATMLEFGVLKITFFCPPISFAHLLLCDSLKLYPGISSIIWVVGGSVQSGSGSRVDAVYIKDILNDINFPFDI